MSEVRHHTDQVQAPREVHSEHVAAASAAQPGEGIKHSGAASADMVQKGHLPGLQITDMHGAKPCEPTHPGDHHSGQPGQHPGDHHTGTPGQHPGEHHSEHHGAHNGEHHTGHPHHPHHKGAHHGEHHAGHPHHPGTHHGEHPGGQPEHPHQAAKHPGENHQGASPTDAHPGKTTADKGGEGACTQQPGDGKNWGDVAKKLGHGDGNVHSSAPGHASENPAGGITDNHGGNGSAGGITDNHGGNVIGNTKPLEGAHSSPPPNLQDVPATLERHTSAKVTTA